MAYEQIRTITVSRCSVYAVLTRVVSFVYEQRKNEGRNRWNRKCLTQQLYLHSLRQITQLFRKIQKNNFKTSVKTFVTFCF